MRRNLRQAVSAAFLLAATVPLLANEEVNSITIIRFYVDPSDIVILTDTFNGCGSNFFHLRRSNENFKEMHLHLTRVFERQESINLEVFNGCEGDRRIISHGSRNIP